MQGFGDNNNKIKVVGQGDTQSHSASSQPTTKRRANDPMSKSDGEIRIKYMDSGKTQGMNLSKMEILGKSENSYSLQVEFAMSSDGNWNSAVYEGTLKLQVHARKVSKFPLI